VSLTDQITDVWQKWDDVPDRCQQWACQRPVATWCPLCRAFFCDLHDELYPRRMHDCLRGKADE